jgi:peptidoglycan/xylan/chitin deacetylase (PgdA/CDA1 family)
MSKGWLVYSGDQGPNDVMLSFDDGPEPEHTPKVLEALAAAEVKATFFMISDHVQEHAEVAKRVAEEGHLVGSHTITHPFMGAVETCGKDSNPKRGTPEACPKNWVGDFNEQRKEIAGGHEAIFRTLGFVDPVFRFPFGANNPILRQFLFDHGVAAYFWNVDTNDWQLPTAQFDTETDPAKNKGVLFSGLQTKDLLQSVSEAMAKIN